RRVRRRARARRHLRRLGHHRRRRRAGRDGRLRRARCHRHRPARAAPVHRADPPARRRAALTARGRAVAAGLVRTTPALPTRAVTGFFTATGIAAGLGARSALLAAAVVVGQASIGWANDYLAAPRDSLADRPDKPIATGDVPRQLVGRCAAGALVADVPLSLALGWRPGAAHLVAV